MQYPAQRRPGPRPRRHLRPRCPAGCSRTALNEGRGRDPGDTGSREQGAGSGCSLNEGRGRDPGDTRKFERLPTSIRSAQRRPGPRPRRHPGVPPAEWATPPLAQRRPGPRPRRHMEPAPGRPSRPPRSTKVGAETPATPVVVAPQPRRHIRSTKAGAETPATPGGA